MKQTTAKTVTDMVKKLAVLSCPANLHDSSSEDLHLVIPAAGTRHLECTSDALKWRRITPSLHTTHNNNTD